MAEEIKARFRRVVDEAWNRGNLGVLDELHTPDYIEHQSPSPDIVGLAAFKELIAGFRIAYPDLHLTIYELILEGDRLAARWSWTGTHSGQTPVLAIPPTGKQVVVPGAHIFHLKDGKLHEGWQFADALGLLGQLGIAPKM